MHVSDAGSLDPEDLEPPRPRKRWGVRTLWWLLFAFCCLVVSYLLVLADKAAMTPWAFLGIVVGLTGAAYCSIRGIASWSWLAR
jgi:hypothetical protein